MMRALLAGLGLLAAIGAPTLERQLGRIPMTGGVVNEIGVSIGEPDQVLRHHCPFVIIPFVT